MRNKNLVLLLLLIAALFPYFIICFYAMPFADDFCFAWSSSQKIPFIQKFLNQYLLWNGRYTADVLVNFHPLRQETLFFYQLTIFATLIATIGVVFAFIKQFVEDNLPLLIITLFIVLFYLCYQPNVTEGIYWYIGIANYHLGNLCLLLHLLLFSKISSADGNKKIVFGLASILLLIISIGFNEIGAFIIPMLYFTALIVNFKLKETNQKLLALFFIIALIASAFVFLSPGNFTRQNEFTNRYNIGHSLLYATAQTLRFIAKWSLSLPFAGLSLLIISYAGNIQQSFIKKTDHRIILAVLVFTVFIGSFLPYFATGTLGQHRTINYVFFYFIFLWIWFLLSVSKKFWLFQKLSGFTGENKKIFLAGICIIAMAISGNGDKMINDFGKGNFTSYKREFAERHRQLLSNARGEILPLKNVPETFTIVDAKADSTWWVNKCMMFFYDDREE
ncbi:MAG: hypothetical protein JWO06_1318 [Bacteroidota bacterium]|nr:hypothetical protein [Bacteroidota bacterium]